MLRLKIINAVLAILYGILFSTNQLTVSFINGLISLYFIILFRVMIIDLDAHQGNGHEMDFSNDGKDALIFLMVL